MKNEYKCLTCGAPLHGRTDKKFCCERCKDGWHNSRKSRIRKERTEVMGALETNHSILIGLAAAGCISLRIPLAEAMGFRCDYFTRLVSVKRGTMICECFDIRYRVSKTKLWGVENISSEMNGAA